MKTIFIKVACVLFGISMLTSCLGDGDNYIEVSEDFAYIRTDETIGKYAMTMRSGPIKSDKVNSLEEGKAFYVSYKASYGSDVYAVAERFDLLDKNAIPEAFSYDSKPYSHVPEHLLSDSIHPISVELGAWAPYDWYFDDNWEVKCNFTKKEGDEIDVYFYYDVNGQFENGEPLKKNQVIIDLRFVRSSKSTSSQDAKNEKIIAVGSLKMLRDRFPVDYGDEEGADVAIKFRYIRNVDNVPTVSYLGSFYSSDSYVNYFMTFLRDK